MLEKLEEQLNLPCVSNEVTTRKPDMMVRVTNEDLEKIEYPSYTSVKVTLADKKEVIVYPSGDIYFQGTLVFKNYGLKR